MRNVPQIIHYRFATSRRQKIPFARIVQQMCNRLLSGIPRSLTSVFFVVRSPKSRVVFLQFQLTSKSLPHSKCHVISLVDVTGFNLYNRCNSRTDDRTKVIMFNSSNTGQNRCQKLSLTATTIALCKHRLRDLTKTHVTSVLRLSSATLSCLQSTRHSGL